MTIESRLAEIRARAEAATEGPWEDVVDDLNEDVDVWHDREYRLWIANTGNLFTASEELARQTLADAEFIAASRTDLPALLAGVEAVRELHQPEPYCNNAGHTNPDVECPECAEYCTADGEQYPCRTITALTDALEV